VVVAVLEGGGETLAHAVSMLEYFQTFLSKGNLIQEVSPDIANSHPLKLDTYRIIYTKSLV